MKRENKYNYQKQKRKGKALTITLLVSAVFMTGLATILGLNGWNIEKSTKTVREFIGLSLPVIEEPNKVEQDQTGLPKATDKENIVPTGGPDTSTEVEKPGDEGATNKQEAGGELEEETEETPPATSKPTEKNEKDTTQKPNSTVDAGGYIEGQQLPSQPTYVKTILIANKKNPLPKTFAPGEDITARAAFEEMAAEAKLSGFNLTAFSTYRSFEYQTTLYERYVTRDGKKAADTYSARPGYSEHQTGLAFDIGEVNFEKHWASSSFGETDAGKWVGDNAHRFGFILRYPKGKETITGYMHESWHFRYVGTEISTEIFKRNITLEEYLGI